MNEVAEALLAFLRTVGIYFFILAASYLLTMAVFPFLLGMIREAGMVKPNYSGVEIPSSGGLIFVVLIPFISALGMLLQVKSFMGVPTFLFLFVILGMAFLGLIDDQLGTHQVKGFRGHLKSLFRDGRLTTGGFKAFFGAVIAVAFALGAAEVDKSAASLGAIISNFLLVVLAANTINLFDIRPGRAGKIYIFGFVVIWILSYNFEKFIGMFIPILAIMLYYFPFDLRAKVMMGDSGSNLLGASLGMMMAWMFTDILKIVMILLLVALQVAAERFSFTKIIDETPWLKYLDDLGRRKN